MKYIFQFHTFLLKYQNRNKKSFLYIHDFFFHKPRSNYRSHLAAKQSISSASHNHYLHEV